VAQPCPTCGSAYLVEKVTKREGARWQCPREGCDYRTPVPEAEAASPTPPSPPPAGA
jgi:DNA topoisomerase I